MIFKRNKTEKPKNPLGLALYKYDSLLAVDLKNILSSLRKNKKPAGKKTETLISGAIYKLENIIEDISKTNLKTDYRSDKVRGEIISMLTGFRAFLECLSSAQDLPGGEFFAAQNEKLKSFSEMRSSLKKYMKDVESDYF
jgi:hypothetical protein